MSRQSKIFLASHLYPLYIILDFTFNLGDFAFNIVPDLIIAALLWLIVSTPARINANEKQSIMFLVSFRLFISLYYEIAILAGQKGIFEWIKVHNLYIVIFIIFTGVFYLKSRLNRNDI